MAPKTVLITGCSAGGIGSALAEAFQKRSYHVFATTRSVSKMANLADLPNVTLLALDVASSESVDAAVAAVKKHTGGTLDVLVNNSGVGYVVPGLDADLKIVRDMFDVNFFGVVETTQKFAPLLIAAKGSIVNICSTAAHVDAPWSGVYAGSKAAQEKFSEALRVELRPFGVNVISVVAGVVDTNITASTAPFHPREGSFFKATEKERARHESGEAPVGGMSPDVFASKVVSDVLNGAGGRVWRGKGASFTWFITTWWPQPLLDMFLLSVMGDRFKKA